MSDITIGQAQGIGGEFPVTTSLDVEPLPPQPQLEQAKPAQKQTFPVTTPLEPNTDATMIPLQPNQDPLATQLLDFINNSPDPESTRTKVQGAPLLAQIMNITPEQAYKDWDIYSRVLTGQKDDPNFLDKVQNGWAVGNAGVDTAILFKDTYLGRKSYDELSPDQISALEQFRSVTRDKVEIGDLAHKFSLEHIVPLFGGRSTLEEEQLMSYIQDDLKFDLGEFTGNVAELLPLIIRNIAEGNRTGMMTGAGAATVGALAGAPTALGAVPVAIASGMGGYAYGFTAGTTKSIGEMEATLAYMDMITPQENGEAVDPGIAFWASSGIGLLNAGLELVQLSTLSKGVRNIAKGVFRRVASQAGRHSSSLQLGVGV